MLERLKYMLKALFHRQFAAGGYIPGKPDGTHLRGIYDGDGYIYYKGKWYKFTQDLMEKVEDE